MTVKEKAYAKINLYLDVIGRREDGFHEILSVMQSVSLYDEISVKAEYAEMTNIKLSTSDPSLPTDESNLVYRSAVKYLQYFNITASLEIEIFKRIPIGAGLGGGSTDAAATLRALNSIFGLGNQKELLKIAAELGSDVPFCLIGGSAFCIGRGEKVSENENRSFMHFVVSIGDDRISTPEAYRRLDERYDCFRSTPGYEIGNNAVRMCGALYRRENISELCYNIFETVTKLESIDNIKETLRKSGAEVSLMSGSGPSVFGIFSSRDKAIAAEKELKKQGYLAFYCHSIGVKE
ncbi:MAG: 4-(cytidine 5'-diphospho)-2-C-methyl-D-erythritol kinase [Clostridia bacterium]|nr:4-(cytidine 5'-diphospho)-2-C-methyl-D-erythritol kinase [Clostridia bacterium]